MTSPSPVFEFGPFRLFPAAHRLERDGEAIPLPPKQFAVLVMLVEAQGETVSKERFLEAVWADAVVEDGSLTRTISRLRDALSGASSGADEETYIRTVARRGYQFAAPVTRQNQSFPVAPVTRPDGPVPTEPAPAASATPVPEAPTSTSARGALTGYGRPWLLLAAGGSLVLTLAILLPWRTWADRPAGDVLPATRTVAVLPFQGLGDGDNALDEALANGVADSLITRLANQPSIIVRSLGAVQRTLQTAKDPVEAGRALQADLVVEGTARRIDSGYRISVRLIDVALGSPRWGHTFDEPALNLIAIEDRLAARVANALSVNVAPASNRLTGTDNPEAYELFLRGRFLSFQLSKVAFVASQSFLERAITLDPRFARAMAALAYLHVNTVDLAAPPRQAFEAARVAVERALALDPGLGEAHATKAMILWQYDWKWPEADRAFLTALDLEPNSAFVRSQYAFFLASMGRADESVAESETARAAEPITPDYGVTNSMAFVWARRFPEAIDRSRRVVTTDPSMWLASVVHGRALEYSGDLTGAIDTYRRTLALPGALPETLMDLGRAEAKAGRTAEARAVLARLNELRRETYVSPFHVVPIYVALGETDAALDAIDQTIDSRSWYVTWLKVDPGLDAIRRHPRFIRQMQRVGFTAATP